MYISSSENVERSLNTINEMALQRKVFLEGTMSLRYLPLHAADSLLYMH